MGARKRNGPAETVAMVNAMSTRARTYTNLAAISGLEKAAIGHWMRKLRADKMVYVAEWVRDAAGRKFVPAFRVGSAADSPRPGPEKPAADRMRDSRARRAG